VTRETFIQLVLNLHQYRSTVGVHNWVHRTAYLICLKKLRGEGIWRYLDHLLSNPGQFTDPIIAHPPNETDRLLWQRVDALDQTGRILIILRYGNDWDLADIAVATSLDEGTVKERLHVYLGILFSTQELDEGEQHQILMQSLGARWKELATAPPDTEQFVNLISQRTGKKRHWRREMSTTREMVLLGLALLFVILIIWGGNRYLTQSGADLDSSGNIHYHYASEINIQQIGSEGQEIYLPE
jgi:DNA-directed RNA polymerase specialized sigma24 family protein